MYMCIECGTKTKQLFLKKSSVQHISRCPSCSKRTDRYFELNGLMKLIDLLLLKRRIFRHYLFNSEECFAGATLLMFVVTVLAEPVLQHYRVSGFASAGDTCAMLVEGMSGVCGSVARSLTEIMLWLALVFGVFHKQVGFTRLSSALLLSNFYYIFVFVMMAWRYRGEEYSFVVAFLCTACNSIVVSELCSVRNEEAAMCVLACKLLARFVCGQLFPQRPDSNYD